jgi:hypothetical protein
MDIAGRIESLFGKYITRLLFLLGPLNMYNEAFEGT